MKKILIVLLVLLDSHISLGAKTVRPGFRDA